MLLQTSQVARQLDSGPPSTPLPGTQRPSRGDKRKRQKESVDPTLLLDAAAVRRASIKLQEGDVRGAVRALNSDETIAPLTDDNLAALRQKHPAAPLDRRPLTPPSPQVPPLQVSSEEVLSAIRSFNPGSAGGRDGLRPQHLRDLADHPGGSALLISLTDFCNLVLRGGVLPQVRSFFFGATLYSFLKKEGGIRPIAVGLTLRRLVAKVAARRTSESAASFLLPHQAGVGVKGGCEGLVHAVRRYTAGMERDRAFIKIDFSNAFNTIRRDALLEAVQRLCPDIYELTLSSYGAPSSLWAGEHLIPSAEGIQQGDPLGPLLFCLTMDAPLKAVGAEFSTGYLDDVGLGDTVSHLVDHVRVLERETSAIGLSLNYSKCEIIGLDISQLRAWESAGLGFLTRTFVEATFLGSPLSIEATSGALRDSRILLEKGTKRLLQMQAHEAFFLLKGSMGVPKLQFLLRTAPCSLSDEVDRLDEVFRGLLESIANINLSPESWFQASLPVRWGGVGIRRPSILAPSAFLSSVHSSHTLMEHLLPPAIMVSPDNLCTRVKDIWMGLSGSSCPVGADACSQRAWDDGTSLALSSKLLEQASPVVRARLLASTAPSSGSWLHAFPLANLGLRLGKEELRVAVGLRVGSPLVRPHTCVCGVDVDQLGLHGLSCRRSAGRHRRHGWANEVILRSIRSLNIHAELEPTRLLRGDGKRPDGATIDPWAGGRYLVWDFTCPDTVAPSHLLQSSREAGSAAAGAETRKVSKYRAIMASGDYIFTPVAIETLGTWGQEANSLCQEIGARLARETGDLRSTAFLRQRISLAVQRGNAASVLGTMPQEDD